MEGTGRMFVVTWACGHLSEDIEPPPRCPFCGCTQRRAPPHVDEMTAGMEEGIRRFYVLKSRQLGSTTIFVPPHVDEIRDPRDRRRDP